MPHRYQGQEAVFSEEGVVAGIRWEYPKVCVNLQTDVR